MRDDEKAWLNGGKPWADTVKLEGGTAGKLDEPARVDLFELGSRVQGAFFESNLATGPDTSLLQDLTAQTYNALLTGSGLNFGTRPQPFIRHVADTPERLKLAFCETNIASCAGALTRNHPEFEKLSVHVPAVTRLISETTKAYVTELDLGTGRG